MSDNYVDMITCKFKDNPTYTIITVPVVCDLTVIGSSDDIWTSVKKPLLPPHYCWWIDCEL